MRAHKESHLIICVCLFLVSFSSHMSSTGPFSCISKRQFNLNGMHKFGDVILGGIFTLNFYTESSELYFTSEPNHPICFGFHPLGFRLAQTMAFAVEEINRNSILLPNTLLGYNLYDSCGILWNSLSAALSMISGSGEPFQLNESCYGYPPVLGIVGDSSSTRTIAISSLINGNNCFYLYIGQVSYYSTCSCLTDRGRFPSFFRTIPSDAFQVRAMLQIVRRFKWTWLGLLISDDDYGLNVARSFQSDLAESGRGCLAYLEALPKRNDLDQLQRIVGIMKKSTSQVRNFQRTITIVWMASEAWSTAVVLQTPSYMPFLAGTLGIFVSPGTEFEGQTQEKLCTGNEILKNVDTEFLDLSNLRPEYNVYKAVYALAHALHDLLQCVPGSGPFKGQSCARLQGLEPWQLLYYMQKVNFTTDFGDQVSFDESGDVLPIYDVMNWMWLSDGSTEVKNVGEVKELASEIDDLILKEDQIFWNFESKKPPKSVCSESCPPGTRMAIKKGEPVCCFDCIPCSEGKVSNKTDSTQCTSCSEEFWSNPQRDHCEPKIIEFLSFIEPLGISLTTASLFGALLCLIVFGIFIHHRTTPVVRANNSELSFLILLSLKLCFMCSLLFIGHPRLSTCQLRQAAFGISFVLCVSCILVKTMVVLAVFKASKPGGGNSLKWFGVMQQRGTVLFLTLIQAAICTTWLMSSSPTPHKNTQYYKEKITVECVVGSTVGFVVLLGYIGLLAILSFLLAFLARNLPDNFNEAKFITFSMLVFCAVWIAFIPAYINSPGKYADAVEVFAILASSFGLLLALFGPKCYIIILKPEKNNKKALMGRGTPRS
uniref:G-protein coupled receptors family 3 profile domain-containing protein n=1 Tax=Gadus morhua TaxID=8049 RepID=A0A8C5C564_GADMO